MNDAARPTTPRTEPGLKARLVRCGLIVFALVAGTYVIAIAAVPLEFSRRHLPEPVHWVVLLLYAVGLGYLLSWTATERARRKNLPRIIEWFGPNGLVLLPMLVMAISGMVLGSLTETLFDRGWVELAPGSAAQVNEGSLRDFYLWHLVDLVPFVEIPQTLRWDEPLLYTQARVGWLVLLFQALVVAPGIGALGWYWTHRHTLR